MATRSTILYSAAAVKRLLGLPSSVPVQVKEFLNVVWVCARGQRPTFISKKALKVHFVERRKADARALEVTDWLRDPARYTVTNPQSGSHYSVEGRSDRLDCECEDYHWQLRFLGRGCCKHGYAVLQYLGFASLSSYVLAHTAAVHSADKPLVSPITSEQLSLLTPELTETIDSAA